MRLVLLTSMIYLGYDRLGLSSKPGRLPLFGINVSIYSIEMEFDKKARCIL